MKYPDKPIEIFPSLIHEFEDAGYLAQQKLDGYRCLIIVEDNIRFVSRNYNELKVDGKFYESFKNVPKGTIIDSEWIKYRSGETESLYLFDIIKYHEEYLKNIKLIERQNILNSLNIHGPGIKYPKETQSGFLDFFIEQLEIEESEGIIIKSKTSMLILDSKKSVNNVEWLKCKYKTGNCGTITAYTKDELLKLKNKS